jgi:hypothetical protein
VADEVLSARRSRTRWVLAAIVCVQVAVPVWATWEGVPHKFGFHMFTGYDPLDVQVVDGDGGRVDVQLSDWIVVPREDIDWFPQLAPLICADVAEAATVTVRQWGTDRVRSC